MVRWIPLLFLFLFLSEIAYGTGRVGEYFIEGRAGVFHGGWLSNDTLKIRLGKKEGWQSVVTDSSGHFKFSVTKWSQGCIVRSLAHQRRIDKRWNPKWIFIVCRGVRIKIRNVWDFFPFNGVCKTNLVFPKKQNMPSGSYGPWGSYKV